MQNVSMWCIEEGAKITQAVITPLKIAIDWIEEDGDQGSLVVHSTNGTDYTGMYSYSGTPYGRAEFVLFASKNEYLLVGTYRDNDGGSEGAWQFRFPKAAMARTKKKAKS